jgi:protein required for attachment to host cells
MAKLTQGTWVLVADGEKYLILVNQGDEEFVDLRVRRKEEQDNPRTIEQAANRPGRMDDSQGNRSAFEDTDWHELAKDRFAHEIADMLYKEAHRGAFDRLVLVAASGTLGELRRTIHKEVADRVVAEIPKVLTNQPMDEIERRVAEAVREAA